MVENEVPPVPGACAGCRGTQRCWVCDGSGLQVGRGGVRPCPNCRSSGLCYVCQQLPEHRSLTG